jgi:hypothetical protein
MTIMYSGREPYPIFKTADGDAYNGTRANPSLFLNLADNQTWLATQDIPAGNFYTNTNGSYNRTANKFQFRVRMPPFTQWVEFWFWAVFNFEDVTQRQPYIRVACTDTGSVRRHYGGIGGSDTPAGKGTGGNALSQEAFWISFQGTNVGDVANPEDYPLAVQGVTTPDNAWTTANFEVYTVADSDTYSPIILSAYHRVLPATGPLVSIS